MILVSDKEIELRALEAELEVIKLMPVQHYSEYEQRALGIIARMRALKG